ncbi:MAG: YdcF family protein [Myxococcaceae bacterium]
MRWKRGLAATVVVVSLGLLGVGVWVDQTGRRIEPLDFTKPTAVVVLGARVNEGGVASETLSERVKHGAALMDRGTLLVVSGGVGVFPPAEGEVGIGLARSLGVKDDKLLAEVESHSTHENALFTAKLLRERGVERVVLVSDPYHLVRARLEFERLGFQVQTSPVIEAPRNQSLPWRTWWTLREVAALGRWLIS